MRICTRWAEKTGKWFASAKLYNTIDSRERGNFFNFLKISLKLSQAVRRLHSSGLAHSDLSYNNVLIDPTTGKACIIDVDGLVVPNIYPADVLGTPDFIAPEIAMSRRAGAQERVQPSQTTDLHALAVLIYMYLLHRHPLRGGRFFPECKDPDEEEKMMMEISPLFIENPNDKQNRNMKREYGKEYDLFCPWVDLDRLPAEKVCGPYLWELFQRAFVDGLRTPTLRPVAIEWEYSIVRTINMLLRCSNPNCSQKLFVYNPASASAAVCPFCDTPYGKSVPVLLFYCRKGKDCKKEKNMLVVWDGLELHRWHVYSNVEPNEKTKDPNSRKVLGVFKYDSRNGQWLLVNKAIPDMYEYCENVRKHVAIGSSVVLQEGKKIMLSEDEPAQKGRVVLVKICNNN